MSNDKLKLENNSRVFEFQHVNIIIFWESSSEFRGTQD